MRTGFGVSSCSCQISGCVHAMCPNTFRTRYERVEHLKLPRDSCITCATSAVTVFPVHSLCLCACKQGRVQAAAGVIRTDVIDPTVHLVENPVRLQYGIA